jgi:membrane protein YqaA with SNARE-associated domain
MEIFNVISVWLEETLLPYGGIGLMLLAVCDSSFLSLPEVNDILLMTLSIDNPSRMIWFASLTTLGSVIGCAMLYSVGRKGGEAFLQKRFTGHRIERVRRWYGKYGMLAVIIPSLLPPPTPFKIFVLSAGTFGISWPRFIFAVVVGRSIRYFSEATLAVFFGAAAIAFVQQHYGKIGIGMSLAIVVAFVLFVVSVRRSGARDE